MDDAPSDPSQAIYNAIMRPASPSDQDSSEQTYRASSLSHLGSFMAKLLHDAHKLQSVNAELERTKEQLRVAEAKLASLEQPKSPLGTQLKRTKKKLRKAEAKIAATEEGFFCEKAKSEEAEKALSCEKEERYELATENTWLKVLVSNYRDLYYGAETLRFEAENNLQAVDSRANTLEAELEKKDNALRQKDEEMQKKIRWYGELLSSHEEKVQETVPIHNLLSQYIFTGVRRGLIPRKFHRQDVLQEFNRLRDIQEEVGGLYAVILEELVRDHCRISVSTGSHDSCLKCFFT